MLKKTPKYSQFRQFFEEKWNRFFVQANGMSGIAAEPVDHDVVEQLIHRELLSESAVGSFQVVRMHPEAELFEDVRSQTGRTVHQQSADRVRLGRLQMHVTRLLHQKHEPFVHAIAIERRFDSVRVHGVRYDVSKQRLRHGVEIQLSAQHRHVHRSSVVREEVSQHSTDHGTPIAAMIRKLSVTQSFHELGEHSSRVHRRKAVTMRSFGKAVTRNRRDDQLMTIRQLVNHAIVLVHRSGPAVNQHQRQTLARSRLFRLYMQKVHIDTFDLCDKLWISIEGVLRSIKIELVLPVLDHFLEFAGRKAVVEGDILNRLQVLCVRQSLFQIDNIGRFVLDFERSNFDVVFWDRFACDSQINVKRDSFQGQKKKTEKAGQKVIKKTFVNKSCCTHRRSKVVCPRIDLDQSQT
jgi:hypothetical protein